MLISLKLKTFGLQKTLPWNEDKQQIGRKYLQNTYLVNDLYLEYK